MTNKEINIRSIIFLIIGILLVLSLVICIYIVNNQKDLKVVEATVISVKADKDGTGKNDVTVVYDVDDTSYKYSFYYKDDVKVDDKLNIFYHEKTPNEVQAYRVSKYIFICPLVGLVLCIYGLFELFNRSKDNKEEEENELNTKLVDEDDKTQKFKIITDGVANEEYKAIPEEKIEVPIKGIKSRSEEPVEENKLEKVGKSVDEDIELNKKVVEKQKEEIKEVKEEKKEEKKVTPTKKIIPKDYYISGSTLVYEELGKGTSEINFNDVTDIIKTINSLDELVKIQVITKDYICVLIKMGKDDLDTIANTLHNKMIVIDPYFMEKVEHKEF